MEYIIRIMIVGGPKKEPRAPSMTRPNADKPAIKTFARRLMLGCLQANASAPKHLRSREASKKVPPLRRLNRVPRRPG